MYTPLYIPLISPHQVWMSATLPPKEKLPAPVEHFKKRFDVGDDAVSIYICGVCVYHGHSGGGVGASRPMQLGPATTSTRLCTPA